MMVRMREAWPGQSTRVNCTSPYPAAWMCGGAGTVKDEKPRSSVMPRSLLCGCLSRAAVDSVVERAATARGERVALGGSPSRLAFAGGRRMRTQGGLAAVHVAQHADVDVERCGHEGRGRAQRRQRALEMVPCRWLMCGGNSVKALALCAYYLCDIYHVRLRSQGCFRAEVGDPTKSLGGPWIANC